MMTVCNIYEVFYSWFNWQQPQVTFKGRLSRHLLAQSHYLHIFPTVLHLLHAFIASESDDWDWDQSWLSVSLWEHPCTKRGWKVEANPGFVRSFDVNWIVKCNICLSPLATNLSVARRYTPRHLHLSMCAYFTASLMIQTQTELKSIHQSVLSLQRLKSHLLNHDVGGISPQSKFEFCQQFLSHSKLIISYKDGASVWISATIWSNYLRRIHIFFIWGQRKIFCLSNLDKSILTWSLRG